MNDSGVYDEEFSGKGEAERIRAYRAKHGLYKKDYGTPVDAELNRLRNEDPPPSDWAREMYDRQVEIHKVENEALAAMHQASPFPKIWDTEVERSKAEAAALVDIMRGRGAPRSAERPLTDSNLAEDVRYAAARLETAVKDALKAGLTVDLHVIEGGPNAGRMEVSFSKKID